ncbi:MAG: hypothetical protein V8S01_04160 [Dorea sp.]
MKNIRWYRLPYTRLRRIGAIDDWKLNGSTDIGFMSSDHWVVGMRPDDPLADKEYIEKKDIIDKPLILPERLGVQSEPANWFGKDFNKLQIGFVKTSEPMLQ